MIRLLTATDSLPPLPPSEAAVKIGGWWTAYGADRPFVRFWQTEEGGVLACMGDTALAAIPDADYEEAALFLSMQPDLRQLRSDPAFVEAFSLYRSGEITRGTVMEWTGERPVIESVETPSSQTVYDLLTLVFGEALPNFEDWYVDMSHRLRHGCGRMAGITVDGSLAAIAMTTAESETDGLIGGVATHPDHRGKGYAHRCVMALVAGLQEDGKRVWLSPKNEYAHALYTHWGFTPSGEWAQMIWKD